MVNIEFTIPQLPGFIEAMNLAPEEMTAQANKALSDSTFDLEAKVKAGTPRVTTNLFGSITPLVDFTAGTGIVGSVVKYAPMIEYGAPAGFAINYSKGRKITRGPNAGEQTRPYVAHLRNARIGRHMFRDGLEAEKLLAVERFKGAIQRVFAMIAKRSAI